MSYVGKLDLKLKAQQLRGKGLSIKEIEKRLAVSRSSISLWVRGVELTEVQLNNLYLNKNTGRLKGSFVAARNKIKAREDLTARLLKEGLSEIGAMSGRDKFIAGIAMYFAEGTKGDRNVSFSNSDPLAIGFMCEWLRYYCKVPEGKFRMNLYLHDNLDEEKAKRFWSKLTTIPLSQFGKSYIVKNNPSRFRKTKHINGVARITVSNTNLHRRIMGWIAGLFQ